MRVQTPAYTDRWMMGDRYGEVSRITTKHLLPGHPEWPRYKVQDIAHVKLDKSGKTVRVILDDCEVLS